MPTIRPVERALVPVAADAAARISAPNYDEFQGDAEIWQLLQSSPDSVLKVTMAHCDAASLDAIDSGDSSASLAKARENMQALERSALTRELSNVLFVYEISGPQVRGQRQIGLGGMASTAEIRTDDNPGGCIIRNEGVRAPKARGRADLIEATRAIVGTVNLAVADVEQGFVTELERLADERPCDFSTDDQHGNTHRVWLVVETAEMTQLTSLLGAEHEAYVADGNHRSAAAAMLGYKGFLAVFFAADRMGISPYNRLVKVPPLSGPTLAEALAAAGFGVAARSGSEPFQPAATRSIGLYSPDGWLELEPRSSTYDPTDAAQAIDHDIVQRCLFDSVFGIPDAGDERLTFVGANKDARWLMDQVDAGDAAYAVTLAAVTMAQFIEVCRQNKMMPPKSTWFEPKIRSGLVMALLD